MGNLKRKQNSASTSEAETPSSAKDRYDSVAQEALEPGDPGLPGLLHAFAQDVRQGLAARPKRLSCQFIYDAAGSRLFEEICELPEYYPTRTEARILQALAPELVQLLGPAPELVELGSGSAAKTRILIDALLAAHGRLTYRPIDISAEAIRASSDALTQEYAGLEIEALCMEYRAGMAALRIEEAGRQGLGAHLVLWLGSSIGNFSRAGAARFLAEMRSEMTPGDCMLVGIDLRKDKQELEAAYDDSQGVTAKFNKNLLKRINASFGANFDLDAFRHEARYLEEEGRIEMWLLSERETQVRIEALDMDVQFHAGEGIHTENSYKYSQAEIEVLASAAGFSIRKQWFDMQARFTDVLLAPIEPK